MGKVVGEEGNNFGFVVNQVCDLDFIVIYFHNGCCSEVLSDLRIPTVNYIKKTKNDAISDPFRNRLDAAALYLLILLYSYH